MKFRPILAIKLTQHLLLNTKEVNSWNYDEIQIEEEDYVAKSFRYSGYRLLGLLGLQVTWVTRVTRLNEGVFGLCAQPISDLDYVFYINVCASNGQGSEAPAPRLKAQTKPPSALPRLALFKTQFMMANGKLVRVLIHTDVTKYLSFKAVDGSCVFVKGKNETTDNPE
ncbi:unnamed protein product [Arabidopsis lyrata]|nr:unnamed protein product [Arabidopsis lyrata]